MVWTELDIYRRMKLDFFVSSYTKSIQRTALILKTMKLLQDKIGEILQDIGVGNPVFRQDLYNTENRSKNRQLELQTKKLLHSKRNNQ
jgi:CHAD domain-containing protein